MFSTSPPINLYSEPAVRGRGLETALTRHGHRNPMDCLSGLEGPSHSGLSHHHTWH